MSFSKTIKTKRSNVKRRKTVILTSSPYRNELIVLISNIEMDKIKKNLEAKKIN